MSTAMSTATSIATRATAEAAARNAVIVPIPSVEYSSETFRKFSRSITNAARAVPSLIGGGSNGDIFLTKDVLAYTVRTGGTGYAEAVHPGAIDFTEATTNAQIARVKETRARDLKTFNTQEGVRAGLCKLIIAIVPAKILVELEDAESGLDVVDPRRLLATIKKHAAPVTVLDAMTLRLARNASLTFDTADTLATQFALAKKAKGGLARVHTITTSESELMMM